MDHETCYKVKNILTSLTYSAADCYEIELITRNLALIDFKNLIEIDKNDDIITILKSENKKAIYRLYYPSGIIEKKTLITKLKLNDEIKLKYSYENRAQIAETAATFDNIPEHLEPLKYIRRKRVSYMFKNNDIKKNKYLRFWRIDKTIRLETTDKNSKKLSIKFDNCEFFDVIDLEFEYIGEKKKIYKAFVDLLTFLYKRLFIQIHPIFTNVQTIINADLMRIFPRVSILTNEIINKNEIKNFIIMDKIDGERKTLIFYNNNGKKSGSVYSLSANYFNKIASVSGFGLTIIDAEELDGVYYCFDVYYYNGKRVNKLNYIEKNRILTGIAANISNELKIKILDFKRFNDWREVVELLNVSEDSPQNDDPKKDGYIIRNIYANELYKLKQKEKCTIDCLAKYSKLDDALYLYLIGNPKEVFTKLPFYDYHSKEFFGYNLMEKISNNNVFILFATPYRNAYKITDLPEKNKYDGKVLEISFNGSEGVEIHKIREDKQFPNNYRVGLSILSLLYNWFNISENSQQNNKKNNIKTGLGIILKHIKPEISAAVNLLLLSDNSEILKEIYDHTNLNECYLVSENSGVINNAIAQIDVNNFKKPININIYNFKKLDELYFEIIYTESFINHSINLIIVTELKYLTNGEKLPATTRRRNNKNDEPDSVKHFAALLSKITAADAQLLIYIQNNNRAKLMEKIINSLNKKYNGEIDYTCKNVFIKYTL